MLTVWVAAKRSARFYGHDVCQNGKAHQKPEKLLSSVSHIRITSPHREVAGRLLCNSACPIIEERAALCQRPAAFSKGGRAFCSLRVFRAEESPVLYTGGTTPELPDFVHPRAKFPLCLSRREGLQPGGERTIIERKNVPCRTKERRDGRGALRA